MTIWRPAASIRVKVIGLVWREDALLAAEVMSDAGRVRGFRPLGGAIEFGETREAALSREFQEELGCGVVLLGAWMTVENIFQHEGMTGHEFIFAAAARLENEALYQQDEICFTESDGSPSIARWIVPGRLPQGMEIYPTGIGSVAAVS
ncbi:MAG: NUDIX domain-containing protein [Rhizobiaceae bacterium]|nr:NUDIX domain-containing protein [Rhizobiaceae bacterium]